MKGMNWKRVICLCISVTMALCIGIFGITVWASDTDATNLIAGDTWMGETSDLANMGGSWSYEDGKLATNQRDQATQLIFELPELIDSFVWQGDVKIKADFKDLSAAAPGSSDWVRSKMQGIRFLVQDVNGTKNGIIALSADWKPYTEGFATNVDVLGSTAINSDAQMNAGETFSFRIVKLGAEILFSIDGVTVVRQSLDTGTSTVIGLISWYGDFEITNLSVMNLDANQHPVDNPITAQTDHAGMSGAWTVENGVFTTNKVTQATQADLNLPALKESFVWSGTVQIKTDFVDYSSGAPGSSEWVRAKMQGMRWVLGNGSGGQVTLALSSDWKPYTEGFATNIDVLSSVSINPDDALMNAGETFTFTIIKIGSQITMLVNDRVIIENVFDSGDTPVLSLLAFYGDVDVKNTVVRNVGVIPEVEDTRVEGLNLIQGDDWMGAQQDHAIMQGVWSYTNGVLTTNKLDQATQLTFNLPDLTNDFAWSGTVKVKTDFKDCSSAAPGSQEWIRGKMQGVRFLINGSNQAAAHFSLSSDWKPYTEGFASNVDVLSSTPIKSDAQMNAGEKFDFKIVKKGNKITFSIDDSTILEKNLDTGNQPTIGLIAFYSDIEVSNLTVSNFVDPSTLPTPTPGGTTPGGNNPGTGEGSFAMVAVLAVICLSGLFICKQRRGKEDAR